MAPSHRRRRSPLVLSLVAAASDVSRAFCPHLMAASSPSPSSEESQRAAHGRRRGRSLYDSLSYYDDATGACAANTNCFANDGGNLDAHHLSPDGSSAMTTFDVMSHLSENEYGGADVCVFSMQELRLPDGGVSAEDLADLIHLGDGAGRRMHELARSSDSVLLAACTVGRMGAKGGVLQRQERGGWLRVLRVERRRRRCVGNHADVLRGPVLQVGRAHVADRPSPRDHRLPAERERRR